MSIIITVRYIIMSSTIFLCRDGPIRMIVSNGGRVVWEKDGDLKPKSNESVYDVSSIISEGLKMVISMVGTTRFMYVLLHTMKYNKEHEHLDLDMYMILFLSASLNENDRGKSSEMRMETFVDYVARANIMRGMTIEMKTVI